MEKQFYGKSKEDFTEVEKELFSLDIALLMLMMLIQTNPMFKLMAMLKGGPSPDDKAIIGRTIFAGTKLLGMNPPTTQEEYTALETAVEESPYGTGKFIDAVGEDFEAFLKEHEAEVDEITNFEKPEGEEKVEEPKG